MILEQLYTDILKNSQIHLESDQDVYKLFDIYENCR